MRLIDADKLYKKLKDDVVRIPYIEEDRDMFYHNSGYNCAMVAAYLEVEKQPTIEAVPVVHGEWVKEENTWVCSVCRKENACAYSEELQRFLDFFCPKCGADMRGNEHIDEDTKLVIDEDGVMYRVVSRERAIKALDKWAEVVNKRNEEMRGKEKV